MTAALRFAEGVIFFQNSQGEGILKNFPARGYTPYFLFLTPGFKDYLGLNSTK